MVCKINRVHVIEAHTLSSNNRQYNWENKNKLQNKIHGGSQGDS